jgi:hypothetical protein
MDIFSLTPLKMHEKQDFGITSIRYFNYASLLSAGTFRAAQRLSSDQEQSKQRLSKTGPSTSSGTGIVETK